MRLGKQIITLLRKEWLLERRRASTLSGLLLYVLSTVVLVYMASQAGKGIIDMVWITFYWVIMMFAAVNGVAKSFIQESNYRDAYYYTLISPQALILSKMLYNALLMILLSLLSLAVLSVLIPQDLGDWNLFIATVILGGVGLSFCFTLIAAIAARVGNSGTMMAILSFPIILPVLSVLISLSRIALVGLDDGNMWRNIQILLALDGIMLVMSYILYPFIWKEG